MVSPPNMCSCWARCWHRLNLSLMIPCDDLNRKHQLLNSTRSQLFQPKVKDLWNVLYDFKDKSKSSHLISSTLAGPTDSCTLSTRFPWVPAVFSNPVCKASDLDGSPHEYFTSLKDGYAQQIWACSFLLYPSISPRHGIQVTCKELNEPLWSSAQMEVE